MARLYVISGMTGMTGNELARQVLAAGDTVIGFDNFFASSERTICDIVEIDRLHFYAYDLNRAEEMERIQAKVIEMEGAFEQVVYINCAAVVHTEHFYHVNDTFETNVLGMKRFLEQAIIVGAGQFINCSTSEVYSMQSHRDGGVCEDDYLLLATSEHSQRTSYATGKLMTEFFLKDAVECGKIRGCSIRFANVYSKDERFAKHIIPHVVDSLSRTGSVTLLENAKVTRRTFLHNIDSCSAVIALVDHPAAMDGTVYNVATQEEITILELVNLVAQKLGIAQPSIRFSGSRASDPERRVLSTKKLIQRTGWQPQITLSQGLDMAIADWKEQTDR